MKRAFSLLEVMFASAALIVGVSAVASAYGTLSRAQEHHRLRSAATAVARNIAEECNRDYPAGTLAAGSIVETWNDKGVRDASGMYVATTTVTNGVPVARATEVSIDVMWSERDGAHNYPVKTWFYEP